MNQCLITNQYEKMVDETIYIHANELAQQEEYSNKQEEYVQAWNKLKEVLGENDIAMKLLNDIDEIQGETLCMYGEYLYRKGMVDGNILAEHIHKVS